MLKTRNACEQFKSSIELVVPSHFRCPISLDLMKDPVALPTGITFDRENIEKWLEQGHRTCPVTNQTLANPPDLIPNHVLRRMIQDWCVENYRFGVERIPTPRIPVTETQVQEILLTVTNSAQRLDSKTCRKMLDNIRVMVKESERNRRCFAVNGTVTALSVAFHSFALSGSFEEESRRSMVKEILALITSVSYHSQLDSEAISFLGSNSSFNCLVHLLMEWSLNSLSGTRNAAVTLKRLLVFDQKYVERLGEIEGAIETLFRLIKEPICGTTTKACLNIVFFLISSSMRKERLRLRFVEMGMVSLLLERLVDAEKSVGEKTLGVLDELLECEMGRKEAMRHPLAVPVMAKKILRVSDLGNEFAVSVLFKLLSGVEEDGLVLEALQMGVFQKVLVTLQVGCGAVAKDKATKLLKLLHRCESRLECSNLTDFKKLKLKKVAVIMPIALNVE
ncbi:hypothetical protein Scep_022706 [Stephania cephalantha]|uniref:U-box domain-containing protein n=1 Tax=Stephania cephalantha TaxID=152367 RepID=A0AAP0F8K2_9MAGN